MVFYATPACSRCVIKGEYFGQAANTDTDSETKNARIWFMQGGEGKSRPRRGGAAAKNAHTVHPQILDWDRGKSNGSANAIGLKSRTN